MLGYVCSLPKLLVREGHSFYKRQFPQPLKLQNAWLPIFPLLISTKRSSAHRPYVLGSRRCRRCSCSFHPLPFDVWAFATRSTSICALITHVLERWPFPLGPSRAIGKSRRFVCTTIRTRTHGVVWCAGHTNSPVHILVRIDKIGRSTWAGGA
jgi:hypothetical protein